jgi:(1->4)-alpha-D-glucan 1-alpha-D-glucosylmutase
MRSFAAQVLASDEFWREFLPFARRLAHAARLSSLSQVVLKLASPGVADVYQGCELEDLSLVDPDNRRPVDFQQRGALLDELDRRQSGGAAAREALAREVASASALSSGRAKLLLLREGLHLRRRDPELFVSGDYLPLELNGAHADRVVGFARRAAGRSLVVLAPRLLLGMLDEGDGRIAWSGRAKLPADLPRRWREVVSGIKVEARGGALELSECFAAFPVALLEPA